MVGSAWGGFESLMLKSGKLLLKWTQIGFSMVSGSTLLWDETKLRPKYFNNIQLLGKYFWNCQKYFAQLSFAAALKQVI